MKAHFFSCEFDFTAGLPSMEYLGFSTKTVIVTQIYGNSNGEGDENPLERGSFPVFCVPRFPRQAKQERATRQRSRRSWVSMKVVCWAGAR